VTRAEFLRVKAAEITRQREALGLTRAEVAKGIGVSVSAVEVWEKGRNMIGAFADTKLKTFFKKKWTERGQQVQAEQVRAARAEAEL
jgi:DNA-binding transcriptional regulator YiaG